MQEWFNRVHEEMVPKHGGEFHDNHFRKTIAPNADFFHHLGTEMEQAFGLKPLHKSHTSPSVRDEIHALQEMYRLERVHTFCSGRSMGHASPNLFDDGYRKLDSGKLAEFLATSTERVDVLKMLRKRRAQARSPEQSRAADDTTPDNSSEDPDTETSDGDFSGKEGATDDEADSEGRGSDEEELEQSAGQGWVFHNHPEDAEWENAEDEENPDDEEVGDADVNTAGWVLENDAEETV
uniref:DUF6589 domain-containing protein n=1 Tax=Mycena chlorophos TaxID=658473 RepID=A0ABQ0LIE7_MYCCL|nr:predicted protein [Mycena chlorophos]